jgi:hypothetical protein
VKIPIQIGIIVLVVAGVTLGGAQLVLLGPAAFETARLQEKLTRAETERTTLETHLRKMEKEQGGGAVDERIRLLQPGSEEALLRDVFALASQSGLLIRKCQASRFFSVRPKEGDEVVPEAAAPAVKPGEIKELPELDENGMPVGTSDEGEPEEQGAEVLPLHLKMEGSAAGWGKFLAGLKKTGPLHGIGDLRLKLAGNESVRGDLQLFFPMPMKRKG